MRRPLEIPIPTVEELEALENLYRTTRDVRLRTRAQMVLLATEQHLTATGHCQDRARRRPNCPQLVQALHG